MKAPKIDDRTPINATAMITIVKSISRDAAVAQVMHMEPHALPTIAGDAEIRRGSEIYIRAADSLTAQLRIDSASDGEVRCIEITAADYGWRIINVFTKYKCK